MKANTKIFKRWILAMLVVEAVLGAGLYLMGGDATTGPRFRFLMVVLIANFPGVMLASRLGLLGHGEWVSDAHPVVGWVVIFGFSVLFYSACIWLVQAAHGGGRGESCESETTNDDSQQRPGGGNG
ncbi:membrane hypothetical protein [Verrucomicrobia bacterium]|nr:membrane hypothetical protein [Verrucomicrobiota bacterium]